MGGERGGGEGERGENGIEREKKGGKIGREERIREREKLTEEQMT